MSDVLTKENIAEPMRDIRRALLEADVSYSFLVKSLRQLSPFQMCADSLMTLMRSGKSTGRAEICAVCQ